MQALEQLQRLNEAEQSESSFDGLLREHGLALRPETLEIFQLNLGKLCNMSCRHCHVGAGPDRTDAVMDRQTLQACLRAIDLSGAHTVDLTGGAPELNPHFRWLVAELRDRRLHIIDRCNLTVLLLPEHRELPAWLAAREVEVVCSLPHYRPRNTDALRGAGTFQHSLEALRRLNAAGYGQGDQARILTLMVNPAGAFLAGDQSSMQREWRAALERDHGVTFDRLIALNNMPLGRFLEWLEERSQLTPYLQRLRAKFNPAAVTGLMCKNTISVSWDGRLFDCDFNQILDLQIRTDAGAPATVHDLTPELFAHRAIQTARHCFGCTAGAGSSCAGATAE